MSEWSAEGWYGHKSNLDKFGLADPDVDLKKNEELKKDSPKDVVIEETPVVIKKRVFEVSTDGDLVKSADETTVIEKKHLSKFKEFALNPAAEVVERSSEASKSVNGEVIVDIGMGGGISTELRGNDIYVGVEPFLGDEGKKITRLSTGKNKVSESAKAFVYESKVEDLDLEIKPDLVMAIAPHPKQVYEGGMFVAIKEKFLETSESRLLVVLEQDSIEANEDGGRGVLRMTESLRSTFGEEYEVVVLKKDTLTDGIPSEIMKKHFGINRKVIFNSNSFQGEQKKTIIKVRKKSA